MVQLEKLEPESPKAAPEAPEPSAEAPEVPEVAAAPVTPPAETPTEAPTETPAQAPAQAPPAPKRRGRPPKDPKPKPEPKKRGRPKKVEIGQPEVRTYTPEPPRPIVTHQDFMRYVAMQAQVSKQMQREHWLNLVRF